MFPIQHRETLKFIGYVTKHFSFLTEEFCFSMSGIDDYRAQFYKDDICITIYHERLSYEIYLTISLCGKTYYLNEVLNCCGLKEKQKVYQAVNEQSVDVVLSEISTLFKRYCVNIITSSKKDVDAVINLLEVQRRNYQLKNELNTFTKLADLAWKEKDYKRFVQICDGHKGWLTSLQQKQLVYTRKQLKLNKQRN